jgi:1-acyl-sn-glycerol-3-phosphate acyltransferase
VWGLLIKVAIGADVHFMAKQELFRWPLGGLLRRLGGMAIDRGAAKGVVEQMIDQFHQREKLWLGIAPEGTRKPVKRWKSGFWHIAHDADVPIFPVAFHYPDKTIQLGPLVETTGDMDADVAVLRAFYAPFKGRHRNI